MADKIVVLRDGVVEQEGSPIELYARPRNRFVASFLGAPQMNMFEARIEAVGEEGVHLSVDGGRARLFAAVQGHAGHLSATCTVGIRPEHLALAEDGPLRACLVATEFLGAETIGFATLESGEAVTSSFRGIHALREDSPVGFAVDPRFIHVFDGDGAALPPLRSWHHDYKMG